MASGGARTRYGQNREGAALTGTQGRGKIDASAAGDASRGLDDPVEDSSVHSEESTGLRGHGESDPSAEANSFAFREAARLLQIDPEGLARHLTTVPGTPLRVKSEFENTLEKSLLELLREREEDRREDREWREEQLRLEREDRERAADIQRQLVSRLSERTSRSEHTLADSFRIKIEVFDDNTDVDAYLDHFERIVSMHGLSKRDWAARLAPQLRGQAQDCVRKLTSAEARDYDVVKKALLHRFRRTAEFFRKAFREAKKEEGETYLQAANRMESKATKWLELLEVPKTDAERVWDVFMQEALYQLLPTELEARVRERQPTSSEEIAEVADVICEARAVSRGSRGHGVAEQGKRRHGQSGGGRVPTTESPRQPAHGQRASTTYTGCYGCGSKTHKRAQCPQGKSAVGGMVVVTGAEKSASLQLCTEEREKEFDPESRAVANGEQVSALRDTGAGTVIVAARLVREEDWNHERVQTQMADSRICQRLRTAYVWLETDYFDGRVLAAVMDHPSHDVIIGNRATLDDGSVVKVPVFATIKKERVGVSAVQTRGQAAIRPVKPLVVNKSAVADVTPAELKKQQQDDDTLARARESAAESEWMAVGQHHFRFIYKKGILYREFKMEGEVKKQVCVPSGLRAEVMRVAHDTPMAGHLAAQRTRERLWNDFYWPRMSADVRMYCQSCDKCQRLCPRTRVQKAPMQKLPLVGEPFARVGVDLVGPMVPASRDGHKYILVMVDYATRYPDARALKNIDTVTVAEALMDMWSQVGVPRSVLSDRGTQFMSEVMKEVHRLLSIEGKSTSPYHAQCNGLVERFNGTLKTMVKKLCDEKPNTWHRYLAACLFAYREVPQESTGYSPFELLYGRTVRGPMAVLRELWTKEETMGEETKEASTYVIDLRNRLEETCKIVQKNLSRAGDKYKHHFDKKAKPREFKAGDLVLLLLPTKQNKLEMAWRGPYKVEERHRINDYWIRVGDKAKLYHVNMLKEYHKREEEEVTRVAAVAVIPDVEEWEEVARTTGDIPLIPLEAEETVEDVKMDPETPEVHQQLRELVEEYKDVLTDLPLRSNLAECEIHLDTDTPVKTKQYPLPFAEREIVAKEVNEMLRLGVIEKSNSPYASPIILVKKKCGKTRFCLDFRRLNQHVIFDAEPMPDVDALFAKLGRAKYLTKIDLTKGYWQIPMKEEDKMKTAFSTPQGHFQWTVMPFGLKTAGAIFSRMMRELLQPLDMPEIENFMDDILIATETKERHVECVRAVFQRLREAQLAAKPSKCQLGFAELDYLGHRVGRGTMKPDEEKMSKIRDAPRPTTKRQIRSFLGLVGFYRKFVPHFSEIATPLTDATRDRAPVQVRWNDACERAFVELKRILCAQPACTLPDFNRVFVLRTDASSTGLGAILLQDHGFGDQTIACASRKLNSAEKNYSTVEKELLAVVWGIEKFSAYLYGKEFVLQSDHLPLKHLDSMKNTNGRLMRWAIQLQPYAHVFKSIPGKENVGADFLSRI